LPPDEALVRGAADISVGLKHAFRVLITAADVSSFAGLSGDYNPLHTDEAYAASTNYGRRIVHGAFQVGLASRMVGMYLPGRNVIVGSMRSRFPSPLFYPSTVDVRGEVTVWAPRSGSGTVRVQVVESAQSVLTAEIHVGVSLHEQRREQPAESPVAAAPDPGGRSLVVLTGALSSIGPELWRRLSGSYRMLGFVRSRARASEMYSAGAEFVECDLLNEDWETAADAALGDRPVYGLVHAAWPGAPQGGLLGMDLETISRQVEFGSVTTIRLARWLARHASGGGRMVVIGTTAATEKPVLHMGAYSLGKSAMEHAVRLLAPELASKGISINAVLPSFMPQGMNSAKTRQAILSETAKVPLGRLCSPIDVAGSIEYLFSEQGGFVNGQALPLTGGQL
jgi:NAD(P)-dependent dehydrogenase (short-subunit alcohol dehydrogenase family)/acyl dehydratase